MRGTFRDWKLRVRRHNWSRRKLRRRGLVPDWRLMRSSDRNLLLHRLVWVNPRR